jgi:alkylation response protein AidB-like acyl-CoA dehydrogenase
VLQIANVALGIAQGAFDDVMALATEKVPAFDSTVLAASPWFRNQVADADARLRAARALLDEEIAGAWAVAVAGRPLTLADRARIRTAGTWTTATAASVVDSAFTAAGGSALSCAHPLQRRMRDVHAVTQHFLVKPDAATSAGAVLLGQDVDTTLL